MPSFTLARSWPAVEGEQGGHMAVHRNRTGWGWLAFSALAVVAGYLVLLAQRTPGPAVAGDSSEELCVQVLGGSMVLHFDAPLKDILGEAVLVQGHHVGEEAEWVERVVTFDVQPSSLALSRRGDTTRLVEGGIATRGGMLLCDREPRVVMGNLTLGSGPSGQSSIRNNMPGSLVHAPVFVVEGLMLNVEVERNTLRGEGSLVLAPEWAQALNQKALAGSVIGRVTVELTLEGATGVLAAERPMVKRESEPAEGSSRSTSEEVAEGDSGKEGLDSIVLETHLPPTCAAAPERRSLLAGDIGPDVIVADLYGVGRYGRVGDITAFSVATHACNLGDERASWNAVTSEHPAIIQNLYRLKGNEFAQVGMAWIKHGFYAVSYSLCGPCMDPVEGGQALGIGCSDPYSANLNSIQTNMSPRAQVNGFTGVFPFPPTSPPFDDTVDRRLQVRDADIDPELNPGARFFIEGHYVLADDAAAGNSENNASYREVLIAEGNPGIYFLALPDTIQTQREQPGVRAWADVDPSVVETDIHVPGEGLFILAAKATDLGTGLWRYYYALQNLNSDRAGKSLTIAIPPGAVVSNVGFRDIDYHSGEPQSGLDWSPTINGSAISWSTEDYSINPDANALRFSTLYAFWFDANVEPAPTTAVIGLFKPGQPLETSGLSIGPKLAFIDCNQNGISDACDVDCGAPDCVPPCGGSMDCKPNGVPDECEPDCNNNTVADECDILNCPPGDLSCADCNDNIVPDGCETDCDEDGIPDDCDTFDDTDGDGVPDCFDRCPLNTPERTCSCPLVQRCYIPIIQACTSQAFPAQECLNQGFIPPCTERPCLQGCLLGDFEVDGDVDLVDVGVLQRSYTGPGGFAIQDFTLVFDENQDDDIDLEDYDRVFFRSTPLNCPPSLMNCNDWITGPWESGPVPSLCP